MHNLVAKSKQMDGESITRKRDKDHKGESTAESNKTKLWRALTIHNLKEEVTEIQTIVISWLSMVK